MRLLIHLFPKIIGGFFYFFRTLFKLLSFKLFLFLKHWFVLCNNNWALFYLFALRLLINHLLLGMLFLSIFKLLLWWRLFLLLNLLNLLFLYFLNFLSFLLFLLLFFHHFHYFSLFTFLLHCMLLFIYSIKHVPHLLNSFLISIRSHNFLCKLF